MILEEKVRSYRELAQKIDALEEQKKQLSQEILQLIPKDTPLTHVQEFQVRRMSRLSIKTSLDVAKTFDACKIQEVVDKDKIKQLVLQGQFIPDVSEIEWVQVSMLKQPQNEIKICNQ